MGELYAFMENKYKGDYRVAKCKDGFEASTIIALNLNRKDSVFRADIQ